MNEVRNYEYEDRAKSPLIMWLLWWFTGIFGGHRFYLGDKGKGLGMLFTLGGIGFWTLIDAFKMGKRLRQVNAQIREDIFA